MLPHLPHLVCTETVNLLSYKVKVFASGCNQRNDIRSTFIFNLSKRIFLFFTLPMSNLYILTTFLISKQLKQTKIKHNLCYCVSIQVELNSYSIGLNWYQKYLKEVKFASLRRYFRRETSFCLRRQN